MLTRIFWVDDWIGMMPKPNGGEVLKEEVKNWKKMKVKMVVSLLEREEIAELGLREEGKYCVEGGIEFVNFPIRDRGLPVKDAEVKKLVCSLSQKIENKEKIIIHCRAGIGRSGIITAALLMKMGMTHQDAVKKTVAARKLNIPDTDEQLNWIKNFKL